MRQVVLFSALKNANLSAINANSIVASWHSDPFLRALKIFGMIALIIK
jgi:hypothetical protein